MADISVNVLDCGYCECLLRHMIKYCESDIVGFRKAVS